MSLCGSIHSLQAADWPAFQFDSQRNAYNAEETIHVPLHSSWTFETGSSAFGFASAILSSDRIFAGSPSGRLSAFDRNTSSAAWSAELGGAIYLAPALAGSSLIAASAQGMVYSFNTADGAVLWSHPIGSGVNASPAIRDGVAFIVSNAGKLLALDVANGTLRWSADLGGDYAWSSPAVDALRVYVAAQGGKVFAFDRQSGALLWSCAFPGPIRATPAADGDTLFLGSHDGSFRALSTADGSLRWNHPIGAPVFGGVAVSSQTVYCAALDGSVYALSKADGSLLWKHATGDKIYSSPSLVQGALLIGSNDKNLYALDPQTGTPLWQSALDGRVSAAPAISRGWVMVMTDAGTLHAFNSPNQPPSVPSELAVNSSTNAVLNTSSVAFSWSFTDPDPADAQTAFTLRLSSVAGSWDAPAFDTGRVDSSFPAFLLSASLPDGRYFWQVRVFDTFGEPSPFSAGADSFIWDHAVPVVSIASPVAGGTFLPGHMLEVSFSASDTLDSAPVVSATLVQIQDLGRPRGEQPARVPVLSGAVLDPATLDDGLWLLEISATDSAGNSTTTVSGAFSILHDMAPPRTTFAMGAPQAAGGPDGSIFVTRQTSFTLSALDDLISADGIGLGVASLRLNVDGIQRLLAQNPAPAQGQAFNSSLMLETDPDGLHLLSYFAQDILQNAESIHFSTVAVDNTAPQTTLALSGGQQANVGSEFYASSGTYFSLSALDPETNGVASGLSSTHFQDNNSGLQAYASPFALAEGSHTLTYQSADRLGNLEVLRSSTVFVDAAAPSLSLVPVNGSTLTVAIPQIVASYADARPGINLNSVRMTLDNVDVTAQSAMTETSASFTPATPLAQGLHIITAVVADLVGNAASLNSTFFIDSLTPVTTLTIGTPSFSSGTVFVTNATLLGLSASEPAQISYKVDSASFTTFTAPFTLTGDGPHSIAFFSVDTAGNTESINIRSLTVDATPPSTDLLVNGQVSDATSLVLISTDVLAFAADDAGAGVAATLIALDGAAPAPFTTAFSLTQGTHTLAFHSRDNLDNQELEHAVAITVLSPDSTPPSLSILPVNGSTLTVAIPQIVASYADAQSGIDPSSVRLILDGVDVTAQAFVTDVSASLTPATALAQGAHTVTASVQDTAGNAASAKSAFLIDSQAPVIAITSPAAGAILNSTSAILTATYADAGTGLLPVSIRLLLDETVLPAQLRWTGGGEPTTWQSSVPLPEGLFSMGVVEAGGRVYVAGGGVAGQIRSSVYFASILPDGRLGPWTATTPLPQVNMRVNLIHAQGRIYVLGGAGYGGGFAASYYADVQADGSLGAWTPLPNMPWGARSGFGAVLLSGRVYVYGGYTEDCATHAEAYYAVPCSQGLCHPQTGLSDAPWLATTAMAQDLAFFGAAGMGNRVYAAGGTRGCGQSSRSEVWYSEAGPDGALGAWQQTAQLPQGFANPRMAASDGTFYVMGGNDVSGELSAAVYYANNGSQGQIDAWQTSSAALPSGRYGVGGMVAGGRLYAMGGYGNGPVYDDVLVAQLAGAGRAEATYVAEGLGEGGHVVRAEAMDRVGNASFAESTFTIQMLAEVEPDILAPRTSLVLGAGGIPGSVNYVNAATPISFTVVDDSRTVGDLAGVGVAYSSYSIDGGAYLSYMTPFTLPAGEHTVQYRSADLVGNVESVHMASFAVDAQGPVIAITSPAAGAYVATTLPDIHAEVGDLGAGVATDSIHMSLDGSPVPAVASMQSGVGTWTSGGTLPNAQARMGSVLYGNRAYLIGGVYGSGATADVRYAELGSDGQAGAWTQTTPLPEAISDARTVLIGNRIYAAGGYIPNHEPNHFILDAYYADIQADGTVGAWHSAGRLPYEEGVGANAFFSAGEYVYIGGGASLSCSYVHDEVYYSKPCAEGLCHPDTGNSSSPWKATTSLPRQFQVPMLVAHDGWVYSLGGNVGVCSTTLIDSVYRARITEGGALSAWTELTDRRLPIALGEYGVLISKGYVHLIGGDGGVRSVYHAKLESDGSLGAWIEDANSTLPEGGLMAMGTLEYAGRAWTFGGLVWGQPSDAILNAPILSGKTLLSYVPGTALSQSSHTITVSAQDKVGNASSASTSFFIDSMIPVTSLSIGTPSFSSATVFVTNVTPLSLSASEPAQISYSVDSASFTAFTAPFMLTGDGPHSIAFFSIDAAGNTEPTNTRSLTVDTTPPSTQLLVNGQPSSDSTLILISTDSLALTAADAGAGAAVMLFALDNAAPIPFSTAFSLVQGTHTLVFHSRDNLGNQEQDHSVAITVLPLDATPPTLSIIPINGSTLTVTVPQIIASYSDARSGINLNSVRMTLDNVDVTAQAAVTETSASFMPATPLAQGLHIVTAVVADLADNTASLNSTFFIDSMIPVTSLSIGTPSFSSATVFITNGTPLGLSGSEPAQISYSVDSASFTAFTAPFTLTGDGPHSISFFSVDTTGNIEPTNTRSLTVDTTPPNTQLLVNGQTVGASTLVLISTDTLALAANDAGAGVAATLFALDGAAPAPFGTAFSLTQGTHTLAFHSRDNLGNQEQDHSVAITVLSLDATPPTLSIIPINGSTLTVTAPQIIASYSDALSGINVNSVHLTLNGNDITAQTVITNASANFTPATPLVQGLHTVTASVADLTGNVRAAASTFLVDSLAPVTTLLLNGLATSATSLVLRSTDTLGFSATDTGTGVAATLYRLDASSETLYTAPFLPPAGTHTLAFHSLDNAGNTEVWRMAAFLVESPPSDVPPTRLMVLGNSRMLHHPHDADGRGGKVYVADTNADRILILNQDGTFLAAYGNVRREEPYFDKPKALAVDSSGNIFVADTQHHRVVKLGTDGRFLFDIGGMRKHGHNKGFHPGSGNAQFRQPSGIAVAPDGKIVVSDTGNRRIQVFGSDGTFVRAITLPSTHEDFEWDDEDCDRNDPAPFGVDVDAAGNIYVADAKGHRALVFTAAGALRLSVGQNGSAAGSFRRPEGIAAAPDGGFYVSDRKLDRITKFDAQGHLKYVFGRHGVIQDRRPLPQETVFNKPIGLDMDAEGRLYIADRNNERIQVFGPASMVPPAAPAHSGGGFRTASSEPSSTLSPEEELPMELAALDAQLARSARSTIDKENGGKVFRQDKAAVEVPPAALDDDLELTIAAPEETAEHPDRKDAREKKNLAAASEPVEYGPEGTNFATPVTITLPYDRNALLAHGSSEDALTVHYWNPERKEWEGLSSIVDKDAQTVSAKTTHFSLYQALAPEGDGMRTALADSEAAFYLRDLYAFPNPARAGAKPTIHLAVGIADSVNIRIYDVSGRQVHEANIDRAPVVMDDGSGPKYVYEYVWDGHIPSGVYFYAVEAKKGGNTSIKRIGKLAVVR